MYALRILRDAATFDFTPYIKALLDHPAPEVCIEALALIEQTCPPGLEGILHTFLASTNTQVKAKALIALASYTKEEYLDEITAHLEEREIEIQAAAIVGLVKYYGIEGMFRSVAN